MQRTLRAYRRPFYDLLRPALAGRGIALRLVHTTPSDRVEPGAVPGWAERAAGRVLTAGGRQLVWQSLGRSVRGSDLVVVEQAVQLLGNYPLLARQRWGGPRVAMWGHGRTFHADATGVLERVKAAVTREAHWFFAYNELAVQAAVDLGMPPERVTDVRNATDTAALARAVAAVDEPAIAAMRGELGLTGDHVCVFLGSIHPAKGLPFLVAAVEHARRRIPDLELVVVGDGPAAPQLRRETGDRAWIRWAGTRTGTDLATILALGRVAVVPGWAGLVIADCFAAGLPLVTSGTMAHPPEIAYLRSGVNGLLVDDGGDPARYAAAVVDLLTDDAARASLARGGRRSAEGLTVDAMAERFAEGVERALAAPRRHG
ncbi:MAG: glycosyltransferase family 4 protein [Actinobacteria bacterium]|nr:glycosyltransferase family 4 protein [Actinomycetota bacterium]